MDFKSVSVSQLIFGRYYHYVLVIYRCWISVTVRH